MAGSGFETLKGDCSECGHYTNCPRMQGVNYCFSSAQHRRIFPRNKVVQKLFAVSGSICFACGRVSTFIPLVPAAPFLLLASYCLIRGSERQYIKLVTHMRVRPYLTSNGSTLRIARPPTASGPPISKE